MLTKVTIDTVDVTTKVLNYSLERVAHNEISIVKPNFKKSLTDLLSNIKTGSTLEMWRGWTTSTDEKVFNGFVTKVNTDGKIYQIDGSDKIWQLINKSVTYSYDYTIDASAGKISEIFKDLVTTYGGLNADDTSIHDSGTVNIMKRFVCDHVDVYDRCMELARILDWQFYYRADTDLVYFEPRGHTTNANTLTVGKEIMAVPKWKENISNLINDITIMGGEQIVTNQQTEAGDGSTRTFTTKDKDGNAVKPTNIEVYIDTVIQAGGISGSTTDPDYTVDKEKKEIRFTDIPAGATDIVMYVSYIIPTPIHVRNQDSIDAYVPVEKTFLFPDLKDPADIELKANALLARFSVPFVSTKLKIKASVLSTLGLRQGQTVRVVDSYNTLGTSTIDRNVTVLKHTIRYPSDYDILAVGDEDWKSGEWETSIEERLRRVEEQTMERQGALLHIISHTHGVQVRRYNISVATRTISNSFVFGHEDNGQIGVTPLGDRRGAWATQFVATY